MHRTNHADVVGELRGVRKQVADLEPALTILLELERAAHQVADWAPIGAHWRVSPVRRSVEPGQRGLRVEGIDVTRSSVHEQEDSVFCAGFEMRRLCRQQTARRPSFGGRSGEGEKSVSR